MGEMPEMTNREKNESTLEQVDVEVRSPSIVLSVRLDEQTAKRLHGIARERGVRISDLLREAATAYAESPPAEASRPYVVEFARSRVAVGIVSVNSQGSRPESRNEEVPSTSGWGMGVTTGAASAG